MAFGVRGPEGAGREGTEGGRRGTRGGEGESFRGPLGPFRVPSGPLRGSRGGVGALEGDCGLYPRWERTPNVYKAAPGLGRPLSAAGRPPEASPGGGVVGVLRRTCIYVYVYFMSILYI